MADSVDYLIDGFIGLLLIILTLVLSVITLKALAGHLIEVGITIGLFVITVTLSYAIGYIYHEFPSELEKWK